MAATPPRPYGIITYQNQAGEAETVTVLNPFFDSIGASGVVADEEEPHVVFLPIARVVRVDSFPAVAEDQEVR